MDLAKDRAAILQSASGKQNFWDALDHLPPVAEYGRKSDERSQLWANASLTDYVLVTEYLRIALSKLQDDEKLPQEEKVPADIKAQDRDFLLHCRYSRSTVPQLIAARKIKAASEQTSLLIYRLWSGHKGLRTEPGVESLHELRSQLGWIEPAMLHFMLSDANGLEKLPPLQKAVNSLSVTASWLYAELAVEKWPPSLSGDDAMKVLSSILVAAATVMGNPEYLPLTRDRTWEKLASITAATGKSYGTAVRDQIKAANTPSGSRFVAVLDPTYALYAAAVGVVGPALRSMRTGKDDGLVDRAIETYVRVRASFRPPEMDRTATHDLFTDFIIPEEGDGLWPASIPEVEFLVRDLLVRGGLDRALNTPQEMLAEAGGGWVWLRTPWSLPIELIDSENVQEWHRRAPLLGWVLHASTNPSRQQNFCANHDTVVATLRAAWSSDVERKRYSDLWTDFKSVAIPGAIGTGFLLSLFPDVPHAATGAMAAMIYPLIKLIQKFREADDSRAK